jgi:hypothetical protein
MKLENYIHNLNASCEELLLETNDKLRIAEIKNLQTVLIVCQQTQEMVEAEILDLLKELDEVAKRVNDLSENPKSAGAHEKHRQHN